MEQYHKILDEEMEIYREKDLRKKMKKYFERYTIEVLLLFIFSMLLCNMLAGRYANRRMATQWLTKMTPLIHHSFAKCGDQILQPGDELEFEQCSMNEFPLMCCGR